jgi:hypothetical protein
MTLAVVFSGAAKREEDRRACECRPTGRIIPRNDFGRMNVLSEERSAPVSTSAFPLPVSGDSHAQYAI